jgi:hypothetical protein
MRKLVYLIHCIKALIFRAVIFFPFELMGYLPIFRTIPPKSGKRIAFQAYNPQTAQIYLPIINALRKNPGIDIWFVVMFHPYHGLRGIKETASFAVRELGISRNRVMPVWNSYWQRFDCLVCCDVYAKFPIVRTRKILLPHGAGLLSRWVKRHPLRKTVSDFDSYLLCGEFDRFQVRDLISEKTSLRVVGFPFVDTLFERACRHGEAGKRVSAAGRKTVLYAPSWGHPYAYGEILSRNLAEVMECLRDKAVDILLKLHAASFYPAQSRGVRWKKMLSKYRAWKNVTPVFDLNDIPSMKTADVLITDISSRSLNFMITDRPVIIYGVPADYSRTEVERRRLNKILEGAYLAQDRTRLSALLDRCLICPDEMSVVRRRVVEDVFAHPGRAAVKTAERLVLEMETR